MDPLNGTLPPFPQSFVSRLLTSVRRAVIVLVGNPCFSPEGDREHEAVPILKAGAQLLESGTGQGADSFQLNDFALTTEFSGEEALEE